MLKRVLCVEDDPLLQCYYRRMMESVSFAEEILSARNGLEALDHCYRLLYSGKLEERELDLIILDLEMPVMGGRRFFRIFEERLINKFPKTKMVILTSAENPVMQQKALHDPLILDYLYKPMTFGMLERLEARLIEPQEN